MLYRAKIGAFWHSRRHARTTNSDNLSVLARVSSPRVSSSPIWTRVSSGLSHLVEMVPGELHSHLSWSCGLAGASGRGESEPMEGHYGFLEASLHSKSYIALIGPAGDNHDISNRGKDDMSRDPPLPGAPARPQDQLRWECDSPGTISTRCD